MKENACNKSQKSSKQNFMNHDDDKLLFCLLHNGQQILLKNDCKADILKGRSKEAVF